MNKSYANLSRTGFYEDKISNNIKETIQNFERHGICVICKQAGETKTKAWIDSARTYIITCTACGETKRREQVRDW